MVLALIPPPLASFPLLVEDDTIVPTAAKKLGAHRLLHPYILLIYFTHIFTHIFYIYFRASVRYPPLAAEFVVL